MWRSCSFPFNSRPSDRMWHAQCCYAYLNWLLTSHQSAWPRHRANAAVSSSTGMTHTQTSALKDTNKLLPSPQSKHAELNGQFILNSQCKDDSFSMSVSLSFSPVDSSPVSPSPLLPLTLLCPPSCCSTLSGDYDFKLRKWKLTGSLQIRQKLNEY